MPSAEDLATEPALVDEAERVKRWRADCLETEGIPPYEAELLSSSRADLHQIIDAHARGCDITLLLRIFL